MLPGGGSFFDEFPVDELVVALLLRDCDEILG